CTNNFEELDEHALDALLKNHRLRDADNNIPGVYTGNWLIELHPDSSTTPQDLSMKHGIQLFRPVTGIKHQYEFVDPQHKTFVKNKNIQLLKKLRRDPSVRRVVQQRGYPRSKRGYISVDELKKKFYSIMPKDPDFKHQWYLLNDGQAKGLPRLDLNVVQAWALGYTGKNVTTAIMDDGVDYTHPDLRDNFNADASYDFSSGDPFPYPRYTDDWFNSHGTRCAGEVAAARGNNICGVGVAYDSKIAGIRMLDQPYMTDLIEANSMGHEPQLIDIYSASWGPTDDGKTVDGPRAETMRAIVRGINEGRKGLGSIYVWASGDGGENDDCNCDGYAASMWTVSINSAINDGRTALYDESCSSTLASTFSNGRSTNPEAGVATTDLYGNCTLKHSGTSAAAPEAAGIFALALEANPKLTWRDIQHLTVLTAKRNQLYDPTKRYSWHVNGAGLEFNHLFGYGVLDAGDMVRHAKTWKPLPNRSHCQAGSIHKRLPIPKNGNLTLHINTTACKGFENEVNYLEHVQAYVTLKSQHRGSTVIFITSPLGTKSLILSKRPLDDDSKVGFLKWPFMTTHTWAERAPGTWTLEIMVEIESANVKTEQQFRKLKGKKYDDKSATRRKRTKRFADANDSSNDSLNNQEQSNDNETYNNEENGEFLEWILFLHGTKEQLYNNQTPLAQQTKLSVAKKIHEANFAPDTSERVVSALKRGDHQTRIGGDLQAD
ncbi:hypothetical protein SNEBB_011353, partial [Seison nebaliae]